MVPRCSQEAPPLRCHVLRSPRAHEDQPSLAQAWAGAASEQSARGDVWV